jgi:hypothetical protein
VAEQVKELPAILRSAYQQYSQDAPSMDVLNALLQQIAEASFSSIHIVIDGVDECPDRQPFKQMLLAQLNHPRTTSKIKILVSSRPEHDLRRTWANRPQFLILPRHVQPSLEVHVQKELLKLPKLLQLPLSVQVDIATSLVCRADGMFRWVQCQIDALRKTRTSRALQNALSTLPDGLFETYDRILKQIDESDHEHVIRILKWLVGSERPMTLAELAEAIAIDPTKDQFDLSDRFMDPDEVLELCGSLISVRHDRKVVLAHFSVQEYLLSNQLKQSRELAKFALNDLVSRQYISRCLLTYVYTVGLHIQQLSQHAFDESKYPLLQYAKDTPIPRFHDFIAISSWAEAHFPSDEKGYAELRNMIQYAKPPAPHKDNYMDAWFVQVILLCALMCYWNEYLGLKRTEATRIAMNATSERIGEMLVTLQLEW